MNTKQKEIIKQLEEDLLSNSSEEELIGTRNFIREIAKNKLKNPKETTKSLLEKYTKKFNVKNKSYKTSYDLLKETYNTSNIISEIKNSPYLLESLTNNKHAFKALSGELKEKLSHNNTKKKEESLTPSTIKESPKLKKTTSYETESDNLLLNLIEEVAIKLIDIKKTKKIKSGMTNPTNFIEKLCSSLVKALTRKKTQPKSLVVVNELNRVNSLKESKLLKNGLSSPEILDSFLTSYIKLNLFKDTNDIKRHNSEILDLMSVSKQYLNKKFNLNLNIELDEKSLSNVENFLQKRSDSLKDYLVKEISETSSNSILATFLEELTKESVKIVKLSTNYEQNIL